MAFQHSRNIWTSSKRTACCVQELQNETTKPTKRESGFDYSISTTAVISRSTRDVHVMMTFVVGIGSSLL
jgi:hypothetical protein